MLKQWSGAAGRSIARRSWGGIGIRSDRRARAPIVGRTLRELRDQLAGTNKNLSSLTADPAFRTELGGNPEAVVLSLELARLSAVLAEMAGALATGAAASPIAAAALPAPGSVLDEVTGGGV